MKQEMASGGCLDVDPSIISGIDAFPPGYIDKENEIIVGLQTDAPLKRAIKPNVSTRPAAAANVSGIEKTGWILKSLVLLPLDPS